MDDDQQYCLRWNNHQSTLISVFDTLLENETLVDCTLAAEGKILKAHKVVLSACSPYFATLLQEQYDKHPVFILKDVKYQELRAMMDYMYRGEVNISQDQLAALLKAAESLQIKGLSDNRAGSSAAAAAPKPEQHLRGKMGTGYTLEQTKRARMATGAMDAQDVSGSREGSSSPSRRRRKVRRRSMENDAHDNSNSSVMQAAASNQLILQQSNAASALVATQMPIAAGVSIAPGSAHTSATGVAGATQGTTQQQVQPLTTTSVNKKTDSAKGITTSISTAAAAAQQSAVQTSEVINTENVQVASGSSQCGAVIVGVEEQDVKSSGDKANHKQKLSKEATTSAGGSEMVIEPKAEYDDEGHEETVEDLTLDDEEIGMEELDQTAGTSQGGEGSSQGYAAWQHDRSQEELLLATQEAQQRDPQDLKYGYQLNPFGVKHDGGGEYPNERFPCAVCGKSYLRKRHLQRHMRDECIGIPPRFSCELCPSRFRRKYHMVRHLISKHAIPPNIAQQTTGGGSRSSSTLSSNNVGTGTAAVGAAALMALGGAANGGSSCTSADNASIGSAGSQNGCDSPIPENLSLRKDHQFKIENMPISPRCTSPLPPHLMPMPTYGLTGAITAISAAAAVVEEQAAAAAAVSVIKNNNEHEGTNAAAVNIENDLINSGEITIKAEPVTPSKADNLIDEEWKMKLGLQIISNSLLKERLMNTIPFAYNNN